MSIKLKVHCFVYKGRGIMVYMNIEWLNIKLEKEDYGDKEKGRSI